MVMDEREFYELCQTYRCTPMQNFVEVREGYDALVTFVRKAIADEREACVKFIEDETRKDAAIQETTVGVKPEEYYSWRIAQALRERK
jgi:hypothetical protein